MSRAQNSAPERRAATTVVVLALMLAGCVRHGPPAPVISATGTHQSAADPATPFAAGERPDSIIVQPGETLYGVSRRYGVPLRSLIEANDLQPPFGLVSGRRLILPQVRTYTVQPGDTLLGLSRHFGVDASTLARSNDIAPPYPVKLGQVLILPPPVQAAVLPAAPNAPTVNAGAAVTAEQLAAPPLSAADAAVTQSSPVWREAASRQAPTADAGPVAAASASPQSGAGQPIAGQSSAAASTPPARPPVVATLPPAPEPGTPLALPDLPHTGRGFAWPVRGPVLVGYGPGTNGTQNDGINIAAPLGTPILAANDGVVAYAGNELRGFGNLVLLKHADGWTTAYAHCESIAVKRGDRVALAHCSFTLAADERALVL